MLEHLDTRAISTQCSGLTDFSALFLCLWWWKIVVRKGRRLWKAASLWISPHVQLETLSLVWTSQNMAHLNHVNMLLRPVVSMLGTTEYHLAKYLVSIINENMPNRYMLDSNFLFICKLNQFWFIPSHVLVSYDVESLFTSIPLQEAIENACKHVYQQNDPPKYPMEIFRKLLQIATGWYFLNKGKLYCQIDGVTIIRPLGQTLANFFLPSWKTNLWLLTWICYLLNISRYEDDIFCIIDCQENYLKNWISSTIYIQI